MTATEFNTKYDKFIERRTYLNKYSELIEQKFDGLEFDIPEVTEYLDVAFTPLVLMPGFTFTQIKLKFGSARVYTTAPGDINLTIERTIDKIIKELKV